jgi:hypothetical protein
MDRTFAFHITDYLSYCVLRRDCYQHVDVVCLEMSFQNLALFLTGKITENFTKVLAELAIESFSPALRYPDHMVLSFPL